MSQKNSRPISLCVYVCALLIQEVEVVSKGKKRDKLKSKKVKVGDVNRSLLVLLFSWTHPHHQPMNGFRLNAVQREMVTQTL